MSSGAPRDDLEARLLHGTRALTREASFFSQAVADRLGLALTDVECLDLLADAGPVTAGRLSELSGLTSGATTRMIDRLEQAGYVRRVSDPVDRRRVVVEVVRERAQAISQLHQAMREAEHEAIGDATDDELRVLVEFLERGADLVRAEAARMRAPEQRDATEGGSFAAPLAGLTSARLVFLSGAPNVSIRTDATIRDLYRARFDGGVPRVRVRGNVVTVSYPKFGWFDWRTMIAGQSIDASVHWRRDRGELALNSHVRWAVELRGGASRLSADLRAADLESLESRGGASKMYLDLGNPSGVVPIRIAGGVNSLSVRRPQGVAIALTVRGGANHLTLDGERIAASGGLSLQSPGSENGRDRFDVEIAGGANKVSIVRN